MGVSAGTTLVSKDSMTFAKSMSLARLSPVAEVSNAWAVACIKSSVGFTLLRLQRNTRWERFLWSMVILQGVIAAFQTVMMTTLCIPLEGLWNPLVTEKKCWRVDAYRASFTVTSTLVIATDITISLTPLSFIFSHPRLPASEICHWCPNGSGSLCVCSIDRQDTGNTVS
jgi:hypothetical protein